MHAVCGSCNAWVRRCACGVEGCATPTCARRTFSGADRDAWTATLTCDACGKTDEKRGYGPPPPPQVIERARRRSTRAKIAVVVVVALALAVIVVALAR